MPNQLFLNLVALLSTLLFPLCGVAQTLSIEQFGGRANDPTYDNGPALTKLLNQVQKANRSGEEVIVTLRQGEYHIWDSSLPTHELFISNHDHVDQRPVAFWLKDLRNVKIVGAETRLLFHGRLIPFVLSGCENVTIQNVSIDYPRPALTQITIKKIENDVVTAEVLDESRWSIKDENQIVLECEGFQVVPKWCMPFSEDGHMKWNRADVSFNPTKIERSGKNLLRIYGWGESGYLMVGDVYVLRSSERPTPGIVLTESRDILLRDLVVHYAEGMGLLAQNSDNLTLDHFAVRRSEKSPRFFTTQADATHFSGCRGYIRSTDGLYENMADDAINIHGTYLRVDSVLSDNRLKVAFAHGQTFGIGWYRDGDEVTLIDRNTLRPVFSTTCIGYQSISPKGAYLILRDSLPSQITDGATPLAVENTSAYPTVDFGYNTIRNNRARGALFSTRKRVVCHHNLFDHTHGSAILLCGDANGWYESGPCEEIIISDNHFVNALTAKYQFTHAVISIDPEIRQKSLGFSYHGRVVVQNNTFTTFPSPLYYSESVRELTIKDNLLIPTSDYTPIFDNTDSRVIP